MKIAIIGAGKWGLTIIGHFMSKAHKATLSLRPLRQSARATGRTESAYVMVIDYSTRMM